MLKQFHCVHHVCSTRVHVSYEQLQRLLTDSSRLIFCMLKQSVAFRCKSANNSGKMASTRPDCSISSSSTSGKVNKIYNFFASFLLLAFISFLGTLRLFLWLFRNRFKAKLKKKICFLPKCWAWRGAVWYGGGGGRAVEVNVNLLKKINRANTCLRCV